VGSFHKCRPVRAAALAVACLSCLAGGGNALAERTQAGNLIVSLEGKLEPRVLPRTHTAPVALSLSSEFATADGQPPPRLRQIAIAIGKRGRLLDAGMPVCRPRQVRATTPEAARAACWAARVGYGRIAGRLVLPGGDPVPFSAALTAYNSRRKDGRRMILADAHSGNPPTSFMLRFDLRRRGRSAAPTLVAQLPSSIGRWARLTKFELTLHRIYTYEGERRSYLNAVCAIPPPFTSLVFPLATVTYTFATQKVSIETVRACRVGGK
jgi:hypothetical protein